MNYQSLFLLHNIKYIGKPVFKSDLPKILSMKHLIYALKYTTFLNKNKVNTLNKTLSHCFQGYNCIISKKKLKLSKV